MTENKVYSDEKIKDQIRRLGRALFPDSAAMLQQLLDERDAARKEVKALERAITEQLRH